MPTVDRCGLFISFEGFGVRGVRVSQAMSTVAIVVAVIILYYLIMAKLHWRWLAKKKEAKFLNSLKDEIKNE